MKFEEFKYLVENAVDLFKIQKPNRNYYEDVAWDYARGILNTQNMQNIKNIQNTYDLLINKLKYLYKNDLFPKSLESLKECVDRSRQLRRKQFSYF